ncbi:hypothetical protein RSOLAG22IIIB_09253 [Rhizoctonia solani]|uniref:Uncharacterized protein n=1 Tax=Rhizoctonia solani TaxID=456999 RepID=A0A0K6FXI8_9AGAM|nr:hypothetical protein RSOLAG22IIIB_09253 [Rhizoctonia solani]
MQSNPSRKMRKLDPPAYAYIIAVPNPHESPGLHQKYSLDENSKKWTRMFWLKIGDSDRVLSRAEQYEGANPSQKMVIIKLADRVYDKNYFGLGKQIQKEYFSKHMHRDGGMIPGRSSEWFGLYGEEDDEDDEGRKYGVRAKLIEALNKFIQIDIKLTPETLEDKNPLSWEDMEITLKRLARFTEGPPRVRTTEPPSLPKYPMIAIAITPNILQKRTNDDFVTRGYKGVRGLDPQEFTYWIKISSHNTQNNTSYHLFANNFRSYVPDFGYEAYLMPTNELNSLEWEVLGKTSTEDRLKFAVTKAQEHLEVLLRKYYRFDVQLYENGWMSVTGSINRRPKRNPGIEFLVSLVSGFHQYSVPLWEEAFPPWVTRPEIKWQLPSENGDIKLVANPKRANGTHANVPLLPKQAFQQDQAFKKQKPPGMVINVNNPSELLAVRRIENSNKSPDDKDKDLYPGPEKKVKGNEKKANNQYNLTRSVLDAINKPKKPWKQ